MSEPRRTSRVPKKRDIVDDGGDYVPEQDDDDYQENGRNKSIKNKRPRIKENDDKDDQESGVDRVVVTTTKTKAKPKAINAKLLLAYTTPVQYAKQYPGKKPTLIYCKDKIPKGFAFFASGNSGLTSKAYKMSQEKGYVMYEVGECRQFWRIRGYAVVKEILKRSMAEQQKSCQKNGKHVSEKMELWELFNSVNEVIGNVGMY